MFKRADARGGGDASAGARLAAHKQQQQQQQQQESAAVGAMDGARIKANQIANLRLMAVLNYRLALCGLWFVVCGLWFVVCGLRFAICGLRFYLRQGQEPEESDKGGGGGRLELFVAFIRGISVCFGGISVSLALNAAVGPGQRRFVAEQRAWLCSCVCALGVCAWVSER